MRATDHGRPRQLDMKFKGPFDWLELFGFDPVCVAKTVIDIQHIKCLPCIIAGQSWSAE